MSWTEATRRQYCRAGQVGANALTDEEWALIKPFMPAAKETGRPRTTELRAVVDALLYIAWTGCQWRALPERYPPVSTVQRYFYAWRDSGLWQSINFHIVAAARVALGREASPTAGVIDSQSAKTVDVAGSRGFDDGKSAPRRRVSPVEEGSTQKVVDWSGSWRAVLPGDWQGRSPATKAALGG